MHISKSLLLLGVMATGMSLTSCDDEEQYQSHPPIFSDVTFNKETIYAGEPFVATAVQSRQATLVDRTTYAWSLSQNGSTVEANHNYKDLVIYPYASENPTDTLTIQTPGTYTLTLDASCLTPAIISLASRMEPPTPTRRRTAASPIHAQRRCSSTKSK